MADYLGQAENINKTLDSENNVASIEANPEAQDQGQKTVMEDFASSVFEQIKKPQFASEFESKDKLWDQYKDAYEKDYGEEGKQIFDDAYAQSAKYHSQLALEELEDSQMSTVLSDFDWVMPTVGETKIIDPTASATVKLETNSGKLQMMDWWTDASKSVREASIESKKYIDGDGEEHDLNTLDSLYGLVHTMDSTGKEIVGFEYAGGGDFGRQDAVLKAVYRGERSKGEMAGVWDLNNSWMSNIGLTSNIAKTTVGTVMNFSMDVFDTMFTLLEAGSAGYYGINNALGGKAKLEDSKFHDSMRDTSQGMKTLKVSKADYDKNKIFTTNNMVDMAINTGLQLLLAGGVAKGASTISSMITNGTKNYGRKAGLYVLGAMASKDAHEEALRAGFSEKEAASIYFASLGAMIQANKLSQFTDEAFGAIGSKKLGSHTARKIIQRLRPADVANSNKLWRAAQSIANNASKQINKLYKSGGLAGAAFSEAMEEEVELVAQEVVNHMANVYSNIGYKGDLTKPKFKSVMDEGYWEEKGWEALLSGIGGAMGGAMAFGGRRIGTSSNNNIDDSQWPVQGDAAQDMRRLAFEYSRGTREGMEAGESFLNTLETERNKGRFGRDDYSTVWNESEERYSRMSELDEESSKDKMSQADILHNSIVAQFSHYAGIFSNYAQSYDEIIKENPEIAGVLGENELFEDVSKLIQRKQDILSGSNAGTAPGVDAQLNAILDREDSILDTVIANTAVEVDSLIAAREKESIEAKESKKVKKDKAEIEKEGQPEEVTEPVEEQKRATKSKVDKLLMQEIYKLAGALGISGGEMQSLLDTQRKLKDIEEGKYVERGVIKTLLNSSQFRSTIGPDAPKQFRKYENFVESLMKGDSELKKRLMDQKSEALQFTTDFQTKLDSVPKDLEGLTEFINNNDFPFLTQEQRNTLNELISKTSIPVEQVKIQVGEMILNNSSAIAMKYLGEDITVLMDEGDTSEAVMDNIFAGINLVTQELMKKVDHLDVKEIDPDMRKDLAKLMYNGLVVKEVRKAQSEEDLVRVTYDPTEVDLRLVDEFGDDMSVDYVLEVVESGMGMQFLDLTTTEEKIQLPEELGVAQELRSKINTAQDPTEVRDFEGEYFVRNFITNDTRVETVDETLGDAYKLLVEGAPKDENGEIITFTDKQGALDLQEKVDARRAQIELIQRSFKIVGRVRDFNSKKFAHGTDHSNNENTFFSNYVSEFIGDPKRFFELESKVTNQSATEDEAKEFLKVQSILGSPETTDGSGFSALIEYLDEIDHNLTLLLDQVENSSDALRDNYYTSVVAYANHLFDSVDSSIETSLFEGSEEAAAIIESISNAAVGLDMSISESGIISTFKRIVEVKTGLHRIGKLTLPNGKTGLDVISNKLYRNGDNTVLTHMAYDPNSFIVELETAINLVGAGKDISEMKLPTIDQLEVAEAVTANTVTDLNARLKNRSFKSVSNLNINIVEIEGLQGTGKTEVVAGLATSIAQQELSNKYIDSIDDHKALMCGNTERQCAKLHTAAKRYGTRIGSIDGNSSLSQDDLYNLLVKPQEGETAEDHIKRISAKFDGIDMIVYDEASYIEFLEKFPEDSKSLEDFGTMNAMLYQLSKINDLRGKDKPKISLILLGDRSQGGFMEGTRSPRNPEAGVNPTGKAVLGAMGSGRIPRTKKLERAFRFEVPSFKRDIDAFKSISEPGFNESGKTDVKGGKLSANTSKRKLSTSWNVISNDATGKLGGLKFNQSWDSLCNDEVTVENIKKQLEIDPEFDVIIITEDEVPADSLLGLLLVENQGNKRLEVASFYAAQGSEASYSLINVPNNMLSSVTETGTPLVGEVNLISMAIGRAKFFSQVATIGAAAEFTSTNEAEVKRQSEPEVAAFRESWYRALSEGLFAGKLDVDTTAVQNEDQTVPETSNDSGDEAVSPGITEDTEKEIGVTTDPEIVVDTHDTDNVESPTDRRLREKTINEQLGLNSTSEKDIDNRLQDINNQLKSDELTDNERIELEALANMIKNIENVYSNEDNSDPIVSESIDTEDRYANRSESDKLIEAEELGTIVGYSGRNLASRPLVDEDGKRYQANDTRNVFGSTMNTDLIRSAKLEAIGHDKSKDALKGYEYKFVTYQFWDGTNKKVGVNAGLFAKPKDSAGDWFMALSFPIDSTYKSDSEFGGWLSDQSKTLMEAYEAAREKGTDVTSDDYAERIGLTGKAEIVSQLGSKKPFFAISRNITDTGINQLIKGTTAGNLETGFKTLGDYITEKLPDVALKVFAETGLDISKMQTGSFLKNRVIVSKAMDVLQPKIDSPSKSPKETTKSTLKSDIFQDTDDKKVSMLSFDDGDMPVVRVKTDRGVVPFVKRAGSWFPLLAVKDGKVLYNAKVGAEHSPNFDAELNTISLALDGLLTDDKTLTSESIGIGHDRMSNIVVTDLKYSKNLLLSDRKDADIENSIISQMYKNMPVMLGNLTLSLRDAFKVIRKTSGPVTFSKPMVVRVGERAGHSMVFYSTREDIDLDSMTTSELQKIYKDIANNRTPDSDSVDELLGLNRDGIGVIWVDQKGYSLSELADTVKGTSTTLGKNLFQLTTWGNANERLVGLFTAIADSVGISGRVESLLSEIKNPVSSTTVDEWAKHNQSSEAFRKLTGLFEYVFSTEALGKVSTGFTTNEHLNNLIAVKSEEVSNGANPAEVLDKLREYSESNPDTQGALDDYNITLDDLLSLDITSDNSLGKGELVRNKKTGKPSITFDVIKYVPNSLLTSLTGVEENIQPEINLSKFFEKLDMEEYSDHKAEILSILDDLLLQVPGLADGVYASPFISLNSKETLEVGLSPDNGDLLNDLRTTVKMVGQPGVAMDTKSITKGFAFENLKDKKTDSKQTTFDTVKEIITQRTDSILNEIEDAEEVDFVNVKRQVRDLLKPYQFEGDEQREINEIINDTIKSVKARQARMTEEVEGNKSKAVIETNLLEHFNIVEGDESEFGSFVTNLAYIRDNFVYDNQSVSALIDALKAGDIAKMVDNPLDAREITAKRDALVKSLRKGEQENPIVPLTDTEINLKVAELDLDNPKVLDKTFITTLNPNDTSFEDWLDYKTSRPSIPHLYSLLTNPELSDSDKALITGIIRMGSGDSSQQEKISLINKIEAGNIDRESFEGSITTIDKEAQSSDITDGINHIESERELELSKIETPFNSKVEEVVLSDLSFTELSSTGEIDPSKASDVEAYEQKFLSGEEAPPILVGIDENGKYFVIDGHRRVLAAVAAGVQSLRAVVRDKVDLSTKYITPKELDILEVHRKYDAMLSKLMEDNSFQNSDVVKKAFEVDSIYQQQEYSGKIQMLKTKFEQIVSMGATERVSGLLELQTALDVLFKNQEIFSDEAKYLMESVQNSLNSSIIEEAHKTGNLTPNQYMIEMFTKASSFGKLSDSAVSIFAEMRKQPNDVPGLNVIREFIMTPDVVGRVEYNKAVSAFKNYLRTKTTDKSVLREYNTLISDSFCVK